ncbi:MULTISPECIES: YhcN/YlaJ family sporulation lipoprotein [Shouchella]|uniref:YhcN/YlaJ family sporulation lipoprotein n=1 Tax=Shouchella TaxID=2893057 RepID=UPI00092202EE|nr:MULTISPECIES: YhcN/YlaJ family sporulation lipoprotein [Shouchella]MBX0318098.1 YhcN/YlaJ family sporulation lipoprotein [Shouchella clausii]MDO7285364.1 YhcN/YlaJ family sporulation lipoprotein [Shouchella clausii]MDO7301770.1 YhcN/YlaJ family sporulation lipoprotein [Shouchella clausii]SHL49800.1 Sporulation lipoprotein YhcN/YlaJ (Spore_YhcN_YlaJ) [Shouchella rhizosphaerae]
MKNRFVPAVASLLLLCACTGNNAGLDTNGQRMQTLDNDTLMAETGRDFGYGFSRYTENEVGRANNTVGALTVDRGMLADVVTRLVLSLEQIEEAATLVTDKYALVVYEDRAQQMTEEEVAEQVKLAASASLPRFYEVYVANDRARIRDIERFASLPSGNGYQHVLQDTIETFKQYPQGNQ